MKISIPSILFLKIASISAKCLQFEIEEKNSNLVNSKPCTAKPQDKVQNNFTQFFFCPRPLYFIEQYLVETTLNIYLQISEKLKEAKQWFVSKFDELHRELLISK